MQIAPERGRDAIPADQHKRVAAFAAGFPNGLPPDYAAFLTRYDGGFPYPNVLDDARPLEIRGFPDTQRFCDRLYGLAAVQEFEAGHIYGEGKPAEFLLIGEDPGGLVFLLSTRAADLGAVYIWQGTTHRWGSDTNNETFIAQQGTSFSEFLNSLYDTPDKMGYDHWATPFHKENAKPLDLQ